MLFGDGRQQCDVPGGAFTGAAHPRRNRTLCERQVAVRDDQPRVELHLRTETGALRACPVGRIERKVARLDVSEAEATMDAGELLGEDDSFFGAADELDDRHAARDS